MTLVAFHAVRALGARRLLSTPSRRSRYPTSLVRCQLGQLGDRPGSSPTLTGSTSGVSPRGLKLIQVPCVYHSTTRAIWFLQSNKPDVVFVTMMVRSPLGDVQVGRRFILRRTRWAAATIGWACCCWYWPAPLVHRRRSRSRPAGGRGWVDTRADIECARHRPRLSGSAEGARLPAKRRPVVTMAGRIAPTRSRRRCRSMRARPASRLAACTRSSHHRVPEGPARVVRNRATVAVPAASTPIRHPGGGGRNRTGLDGFAIRCITSLPPRPVRTPA